MRREKYRYCDGKLIHIDSVHAYNTTGSSNRVIPPYIMSAAAQTCI